MKSFRGIGWMGLILLSLLAFVSCNSGSRPGDDNSVNLGNVSPQATTAVLVLWDDTIPASSGSGVSLQGKSKIGTVQLKPGIANFETGQRNKDKEEKEKKDREKGKGKDDKSEGVSSSSVSAQAFSYTDAAQIYALMMANLLGRYSDVVVTRKPISQYVAGDTGRYARTFYLASTFENPTPAAFITDIRNGGAVTWINYNLWHLDAATTTALGFHHVAVIPEYTQAEYSVGYNKVLYRGYTYNKYPAPMEIMQVGIDNAAVSVQAWAKNSAGTQIPYALKSGNFWYIADNPFSYMHETDRYLVFADLIAPMLNRDVACTPKSLARLEDLNPDQTTAEVQRMLNALNSVNGTNNGIPFTANVIPLYKLYNATTRTTTTRSWTQASNATLLAQLRRIPTIKGRIFQHGYTHMFEGLLNPYGQTGDDFEFWRVTLNADGSWNYVGPVPGMTPASAQTRVTTGRNILVNLSTASVNMTPVGWTTPHYAEDPDYYAGIKNLYSRVWERRLYRVGGLIAGQFFPYPVKDVYGQFILPENLGSIQSNWTASQTVEAARANRALRCPWAGHFFHTFIIDPTYVSPEALTTAQFQQMLRDIQNLGFVYQDSTTVGLQ